MLERKETIVDRIGKRWGCGGICVCVCVGKYARGTRQFSLYGAI